jgi:hypothetical protein
MLRATWHARLVPSPGDQGPPDHAPFDGDEPGWTNGCRPGDQEWVDRYGYLDFPETISNPVDALPPGFPAYTAVLHSLEDPDSDGRVKWINDAGADPWDQVQHIVDHGLGSWPVAADNPIAQPEGGILADILDLDIEEGPLTVTYFFPPWAGTVHGATIANRLRTSDHNLAHIPTFWFPHTRTWAASTPYDAGWTYLASNLDVARKLLDDPRIEALPCIMPLT